MNRFLAVGATVAIAALASLPFTVGKVDAQIGAALPVASTVSLATTSVQLVAANPSRHGITFYNQSAVVISIAPGTTAVTASGGGTINLAASGGTITLVCSSTYPCGNAFQGIGASSSGNVLSIWEF